MTIHILHWLRPRKERELIAARLARQEAYERHCRATDRQDKREMGAAAVVLRAATTRLMAAERAAGWPG